MQKVYQLYQGHIDHKEPFHYAFWNSKPKPHCDELVFRNLVHVQQIRIVRPQLQAKNIISLTQCKPIQDFHIYYRNTMSGNSRYEHFAFIPDLLPSLNEDILLTHPVSTDVLVFRGVYTTLSIIVYGDILLEADILRMYTDAAGKIVEEPKRIETYEIIQSLRFAATRRPDRANKNANKHRNVQDLKISNLIGQKPETLNKNITNINDCARNLDKLLELSLQAEAPQLKNLIVGELIKTEELLAKLLTCNGHGFVAIDWLNSLSDTMTNHLFECLQLPEIRIKQRTLQVLRIWLQIPVFAEQFKNLRGEEAVLKIYLTSKYQYLQRLCLQVFLVLSKYKFYSENFIHKFEYRGSRINKIFDEPSRKNHHERDQSQSVSRSRSRSRDQEKQVFMISRTIYQILLVAMAEQSGMASAILKQIITNITENQQRKIEYLPVLFKYRVGEEITDTVVNYRILKGHLIKNLYFNQLNNLNLEHTESLLQINTIRKPFQDLPVETYALTIKLIKYLKNNDYKSISVLSSLILSKYTITVGIGNLVPMLKVRNIREARQKQAVLLLMYDLIYKILLNDQQGNVTFVYLQELFKYLHQIIQSVNQNAELFSKEFVLSTRRLVNYSEIYQNMQKQYLFKQISLTFLNLFHFQDIMDQVHYHKVYSSFNSYTNFANMYTKLSNFHQPLPEQPLLKLYAWVKIFLNFIRYDSMVWMYLYRYKVTVGISALLKRVSYVLFYLLDKEYPQQQAFLIHLPNRNRIVDNYLSLLHQLLLFKLEETKLYSACHENSPLDKVNYVELRQIYLQLWVHLFNAHQDEQLRVNNKTKLTDCMELLTKIQYTLCQNLQSVESTNSEGKLREQFRRMYMMHFDGLSTRTAVLSLYAIFYKFDMLNSNSILNEFFFSEFLVQSESDLVIQTPFRSNIENIIRYNIYRNDIKLKLTLKDLLDCIVKQNHRGHHQNILKVFANIFSETNLELKRVDKHVIYLDKCIMVAEFMLSIMTPVLKHLLIHNDYDEIIIKQLQLTEQEIMRCRAYKDFKDINYFKKALQLRNTLLKLLQYVFDPLTSAHPMKTCLAFDTPKLETQKEFLKLINKFMLFPLQFRIKLTLLEMTTKNTVQQTLNRNYLEMQEETDTHELMNRLYNEDIILEILKSCEISLNICVSLSKTLVTQNILLYKQMKEIPHNIPPGVYLRTVFDFMFSLKGKKDIKNKNYRNRLLAIFEQAVYLLVCLAQNPDDKVPEHTQRRKLAIKSLVTERGMPLEELERCEIVRKQYSRYLIQYFHQPESYVVKPKEKFTKKQIDQAYKNGQQLKPNEFGLFVDTLLKIVCNGDELTQNKFKRLDSGWRGGDIKTIKQTHPQPNIQQWFKLLFKQNKEVSYHQTSYQINRTRTDPIKTDILIPLADKKFNRPVPTVSEIIIRYVTIPENIIEPKPIDPYQLTTTYVGLEEPLQQPSHEESKIMEIE